LQKSGTLQSFFKNASTRKLVDHHRCRVKPNVAMTLQELLREATRLSLKEQLQLATQLLQLVDQHLVGPAAPEPSRTATKDVEAGSIDYLLSHPILVKDFKPLRRDKLYQR
jgi:hypothetical protein